MSAQRRRPTTLSDRGRTPKVDDEFESELEVHVRQPEQRSAFAIALKWTTFVVFSALWWQNTLLEQRLRALAIACWFAGMEFWWKVFTGDETGVHLPHSVGHALSRGRTTIEQFFTNVWWAPLGTDLYFAHVPWMSARIILFPLNVWLFELVWGYYLLLVWGKRAWHYKGNYTYFHGNIALGYLPVWWFLGALHEFLSIYYYPHVVQLGVQLITALYSAGYL